MDKYIFNEPEALTNVAAFHDVFDLPIPEKPGIPDLKRCELRVALLQEELNELIEAIQNNDLVGAADAFSDLQYVLSGAILEFGLGSKFKNLFDEVQRSNMSKTCKTMDEALSTQEYYKTHKETDSFIEEKNGEFLVFRATDKKVLKSINYSEANLHAIIHDSVDK
ncbi:MAG: nucleoside triphosphate pyrophosphohydrolase family protein [Saprospiraceae bacterium]|nr:nucleoside triphosphate pyrophosphohydrolase family protein [Saprospiraceae bacterium]